MPAFTSAPGRLSLFQDPGTPPDPEDDAPGTDPTGQPPRRRALRILVFTLVTLLVLGGTAFAGLLLIQSRLASQVNRIDNVFTGLENRPAKPTTGAAGNALNILVMGTDRRSTELTTGTAATAAEWVPGAQRTDTIMILHIDGDRQGASLVSIPRDSWVDVPGHGPNKINAAFSLAGPSLAVETVEQLTDVRIDHLAVVDWEGFQALIETVGGVPVTVPRTIEDPHNNVVWFRGRQVLDGSQAMLYVRQRYGLANGDLDRVRRQQAVVRGLFRASLGSLRSAQPMSIYELLDTATRNISVDEGWDFADMRQLVLDLRSMPPQELDLVTVPVRGYGSESGQSVVYLDRTANQNLWDAVREDQVDDWVARHAESVVTGPVS